MRQNFRDNWKYFPWICFLVRKTINSSLCIWAWNMSFTFEILANNLKISLQCLKKKLKKQNKKQKTNNNNNKTRISHLSFLTCYGKQTCFLFLPNANKQKCHVRNHTELKQNLCGNMLLSWESKSSCLLLIITTCLPGHFIEEFKRGVLAYQINK